MEDFVCCLGLVELHGPFALEVDGVHQIADGRGIERLLVEHFLNHLLCVVGCPFVDDVQRLAVIEVTRLRLCFIERLGLAHEVGLQHIVFVQKDGIRDEHFCQWVDGRCRLQHLVAEGVNAVGSLLAKA